MNGIDVKKELGKIEKIARKIAKKWPKGISAVEAVREERR